MIVVDVHEPKVLKELGDVMDLGYDFLVAGKHKVYVVERKEMSDLVASLHNNRLFDQLERVRKESEKIDGLGILVVEGNHFKHYKGQYGKITPAQWMGLQISVAEHGVGLVRTWNLNETKLVLQLLDKRANEKGSIVRMKVCKKMLDDDVKEAIALIGALKGVGEKKAIELLKKFKSIKNIVNADESELVEVLGEKLGTHVFKLLNTEVMVDE